MFSILDLESQFSKQKINKARKLPLREVEEETKNHFVCLADEGNESFDVQVFINTKSEITKSLCDCGAKDFCLHQLALSLCVSEKKTGKTAVKRTAKKKISEAETAMEGLNSEEMKQWLLGFFKKNKDAEVEFLLEFGEKKQEFSNEEIKEIIQKATRAVVGNKKNITAQDAKKITDLLTKSLEPVENYLYQNTDKEMSIEKYFFINEQITNFQMSVFTSSTRLDKFLENFKERFAVSLNSVKDVDVWMKIATKYWNIFLKEDGPLYFYFYDFIMAIYHAGSKDQKMVIAELVKKQIEIWMRNKVHVRYSIKEDLLVIISENNFFVPLQSYFQMARYENSYNLKVLNEILKIDKSKAEKFCKAVIESNVNEKYNIPYYSILEEIYQEKNDLPNLAYIKRKKFPGNYNLSDYLFIEQHEADKTIFKKFRNTTLAALRGFSFSNPENTELYFDILVHEENYKKMIEVLNDGVPSDIINKYAEKLFNYNKNKFLETFKHKIIWQTPTAEDERLVDFLVSKYDAVLIQNFFSKNFFGFGISKFPQLVLNRLKQ